MNQDLAVLYALQKVDSALAQAVKQYHALDQGQAEKAAAESAAVLHDRLVRTHEETARDLQDAELELKSVEAKKKDFESRLYGGKISVPKEMAAAEQEIEALGRQRGRLDERILTLMDQVETYSGQVKEAKARRAEADAAYAAKQAEYRAAAQKLASRVKALNDQRAEAVKPVPPALLKRYEAIRATKQGVGIGRIVEGSCGACHTTLPTAVVTTVVKTASVETCPNCSRLLCSVED